MRRERSRAYSVRCNGNGPLAPNRPKKRWCRVAANSPSPGTKSRASVDGAKASEGDCAKRIGSSRKLQRGADRAVQPRMRVMLEQAHGLEEAELVRLVRELAQQFLARLVAGGRGGLLLREQVGDGRRARRHVALERIERVQDVGHAEDPRLPSGSSSSSLAGGGAAVSPGKATSALRAAVRAPSGRRGGGELRHSTDRAPTRGAQVLTTPRVCEASTSCVKLFMLA